MKLTYHIVFPVLAVMVFVAGCVNVPDVYAQVNGITLTPVADTYVKSTAPDGNYGYDSRLEVDNDPDSKVAYIAFDLTQISDIGNATLRLHIDSASGAYSNHEQSIGFISGYAWDEGALTYTNASTNYTDIARFSNTQVDSWIDIDLGSALVGQYGKLVTFVIHQTGSDGLDIDSRETTTPPQLILSDTTITPTYTPTPTTIVEVTPTTADDAVVEVVTGDAYVRANSPTTNYGSEPTLEVDAGTDVKISYLSFDLTGYESAQSVSLLLHIDDATNAASPDTQSIYLIDGVSWEETTITYENAPSQGNNIIGTISGSQVNSWMTIDLGAALDSYIGTAFTLVISQVDTDGLDIDSRETITQPKLVLTGATQGTSIVCAEDINVDGIVDLRDYSILIRNFFSSNPDDPRADINADGIVDLRDYSRLISKFFQNC